MAQGYRILAQDCQMSNDTWNTGLNNNDLIIGVSGSGKTRGYVLPNILLGNESMIIGDTKGNLLKQSEKQLREKGFQVVRIDFTDCKHYGHLLLFSMPLRGYCCYYYHLKRLFRYFLHLQNYNSEVRHYN